MSVRRDRHCNCKLTPSLSRVKVITAVQCVVHLSCDSVALFNCQYHHYIVVQQMLTVYLMAANRIYFCL